MTIKYYALTGKNPNLFWSVNPWKTRMCLNLKGLKYDSIPLTFIQIHQVLPEILKKKNGCTVPVLDDDGTIIQDSFKIAEYLDEKYPKPSIFNNNKPLHEFMYNWITTNINRPLLCLIIPDIVNIIDDESRDYFVETRTKMFGDFNILVKNNDSNMEIAQKSLSLILNILEKYKFISGEAIGWTDISLASILYMTQLVNKEIFDEIINKSTNPIVFQRWWKDMQILIK
jgi:glutathione S-transferase